MKKIIIIALAVLLCGTAYASKFEVSGGAVMKGKYWSNYAMDDSADSHSYYDFDFNIYPKFVVDENNFAMLKLAIKDIKPGAARTTGGTSDDVNIDEEDENIRAERAWFQTKIGPTALSLGLMDGAAWGTAFNDSTDGYWRVKAVTTTPIGAVVAVIQKNDENSTVNDSGYTIDSTDNDVYYLGLVTKAGPMMIKPLLVYADLNTTTLAPGYSIKAEKKAFILAMDGTFGDLSIEAEFGYQSFEGDDVDTADFSYFGAYLHASYAMGDNAAGLMILYGGTDESDGGACHGYGFGDDEVYLTILDDEMEVGSTDLAGAGGLTVIALYYKMKAMENLTVTPKIAYVMSNYDEGDQKSDGAGGLKDITDMETAYEIDIDCAYKINDAVTYKVALGYASIANYDSSTDPDPVYTVQHQVSISF